jgi:hypothetical protein
MKSSRLLRRPFLGTIAAIAGAYSLLALLLALIDPFDIYPWGIRPKLKMNGDYSAESTRYLAAAVAKTPAFDTILLGGSTGRLYTTEMMEEILPGTHSAFNFSYSAPSSTDRAAIYRQLLRFSSARRFILEADWTYIVPKALQRSTSGFPIYLYDDVWWNDARAMTMESFQLSWAALRGDPLWLTAWSRSAEQAAYRNAYQRSQSEESQGDLLAYIARRKTSIDTPSKLTCQTMDAIGADLAPFVRALSARGVEIDVVLPPYSWLLYYRPEEPDPRGLSRPSLLSDLLQMRRCLVQALGDLPHVRIFAFDNVPGLASDWKNYFDPGHLYNFAANRYILRSIAAGEHVLSRRNIDADIAQLRSNVVRYEFTSDKPWVPEK